MHMTSLVFINVRVLSHFEIHILRSPSQLTTLKTGREGDLLELQAEGGGVSEGILQEHLVAEEMEARVVERKET